MTALAFCDIHKAFGATRALRGVSLAAGRGEVHALIGENGAGKSTLVKILSGAEQADAGSIRLDGRPVRIASPAEGRARGIAMIYQELTLAPHLSVRANLTLGMERSRAGILRERPAELRAALARLGHETLPLDAPVRTLPVGLQQIVEIARALLSRARVVVMDEPTSALSAADTQALFTAIGRLKADGIAVIYISHFLEEVQAVADRFTVLRDGMTVGTGAVAGMPLERLVAMMVGRPLRDMFPRVPHTPGAEILRVADCVLPGAAGGPGIGFSLRRGEIRGLAGLVGAGRSETLRALFGLDPAAGGRLALTGGSAVPLARMTPPRALRAGLDLLSENRKDEGLATALSIAANTTLSALPRFAPPHGWGPLRPRRIRRAAADRIRALGIRCRGPAQAVGDLSGGNQQKVALARILEQDAAVVLLDEPTRGIDVASKVEIYRLIGRLAASGKAVLFVSSYLPELLGVCDTLAVMHRGRMSAARPVGDWTAQEIMRVAAAGEQGQGAGPRMPGIGTPSERRP
jgi:ribose transport system ATP-binding protein